VKKLRLMRQVRSLVLDGVLKSEFGQTFPLQKVADAVRAAATPGKPGKVLLQIGSKTS
jgi:hypothetical protein